MINICFTLHASSSTNLGVGALTVAQVDLVRSISRQLGVPIHMTLLDWKDAGAACVCGDDISIVRLSGRDLLHPAGAWAHLRHADLVLDIGAGDSFADTYGGKRLRRIFLLKMLAHLARRPLVLAPQTLGPFTHPLSRLLAKISMTQSAAIFSRDKVSATHLKDMGVKAPVGVASDVALRLEASTVKRRSARPAVGINVSGLLMSGGYSATNQFGLNLDYPSLVRALIGAFLAHPDQPDVHLIPHVIAPDAPVEDDMAAALALHEEFPKTRVAPAFETPSAAKGYIANMGFFTGARMHACIAALSSGVAVVPLAYSRKFAGLFGALGYDFVADCRTHQQLAIIEMIMLGYENRAELAAQATTATECGVARLQLYDEALSALVSKLAHAKEQPATRRAAGLIESA